LSHTVLVSNLGQVGVDGRATLIKRWAARGGVLLVSDKTLVSIVLNIKNVLLVEHLQADVLVLDEAHTMLRNTSTKVYKTLASIRTPRRIGTCPQFIQVVIFKDSYPLSTFFLFCRFQALTGSPFQNNVSDFDKV
jgi:hypothetical protein